MKDDVTTLLHPNSNSPIARVHSTLVEFFRALTLQNQKALSQNIFENAVVMYNSTIHSAKNFQPSELLFGHIVNRDILESDAQISTMTAWTT